MAKLPPPPFLHALRSDGSISSICYRCQLIIATKPNEIDLRKPEDAHICGDFSLSEMFNPQ